MFSANRNRKGSQLSFWLDVTSQQSIALKEVDPDGLGPNVMLGIPFISGIYNSDPSRSSISLFFYSDRDDAIVSRAFNVSTTSNEFHRGYVLPILQLRIITLTLTVVLDVTHVSSGMDSLGSDVNSQNQIRLSDLAMYGNDYLWINGTRPVGPSTLPDNTFPFERLASINSADQSTTFLYHQINGTTFAEEQWDNAEGTWLATAYITVSDS